MVLMKQQLELGHSKDAVASTTSCGVAGPGLVA